MMPRRFLSDLIIGAYLSSIKMSLFSRGMESLRLQMPMSRQILQQLVVVGLLPLIPTHFGTNQSLIMAYHLSSTMVPRGRYSVMSRQITMPEATA